MASARNEALRVWGGCFPSPRGMGLGSIFLIFALKMGSFGALWELILLQLNCLTYTHKPVSLDFGL